MSERGMHQTPLAEHLGKSQSLKGARAGRRWQGVSFRVCLCATTGPRKQTLGIPQAKTRSEGMHQLVGCGRCRKKDAYLFDVFI